MLARSAKAIPDGQLYEGKWDGFRAIIFRNGDRVEIGSRNERPLTRYFPDIVAGALRNLPPRCVVDGEIIVVIDDHLEFDRLQERIHPAASRVNMLSEKTPASFVAFDLLAVGDDDVMGLPFSDRRKILETAMSTTAAPFHLTQTTSDPAVAAQWLDLFEGAGLDGVIAKDPDGVYLPGERKGMVKIKHERTADCVVAGFRWHKSGGVIGSLLLGLHNDDGELQHVGVSASFPMKRRAELVAELEPYRMESIAGHPWASWVRDDSAEDTQNPQRMPGAQSRWSSGKDMSWEPLRPELVVEVAYDHMQGSRFRHTAQFRRWRPDRDPSSCTYEQLDEPVKFAIADVLR
jgi:ATP-dependent DNA ligase